MGERKITRLRMDKKLLIFLTVAFGLSFIMLIPTAIGFYGKGRVILNPGQGLYPAAGLILAKIICEKDRSTMPTRFFFGYLLITGIMTLQFFAAFFVSPALNGYINSFFSLGVCVALALLYFSEAKEKRAMLKLTEGNLKPSLLLLGLFVVLLFLPQVITSLFLGDLYTFLHSLTLVNLPGFLIMTGITFPFYFGEEYGWRCYFQPFLQKVFGSVKGVLLFGVLWELWHLPSIIFIYGVSNNDITLLQLVIWRFSNRIFLAVFMAYLYIQANNIWAPMLLHSLNNNFGYLVGWEGYQLTWETLGILILTNAVLFLPFLLTKTFRSENIPQKQSFGKEN